MITLGRTFGYEKSKEFWNGMDGDIAITEAEKFKARMRLNYIKDERDVGGLITLEWIVECGLDLTLVSEYRPVATSVKVVRYVNV
jgi:hypothetical protein